MTLISFNKNHLLFNIENSNQLLRLSYSAYSDRFSNLLDDKKVSKQKRTSSNVYLSLFVLQDLALQSKPNTSFFQKKTLYSLSGTESIRFSRIANFEQNAICTAKLKALIPQSILLFPPIIIDPSFSNTFTTSIPPSFGAWARKKNCKRSCAPILFSKKKRKRSAKSGEQNKVQKSSDLRFTFLINDNFNYFREKLYFIKQYTPKFKKWSFAFGSSFFLLGITSILQRQEQNGWFLTFSRSLLPGFYLTCEESSWECFENITLNYLSKKCLPYHNPNTKNLVKKIDCYKDILYLGLSSLWSQQAIQNYTAVFTQNLRNGTYKGSLCMSSLVPDLSPQKESSQGTSSARTSSARTSSHCFFFNKKQSLKNEWIVEPCYQIYARVPPQKNITKIVNNLSSYSFSWRQTLWPFQLTKTKLSPNQGNRFKRNQNRYKERVFIENDSIPSKMSSSVVRNNKRNTQDMPYLHKAQHIRYPFIKKKVSDGAGVKAFLLRKKDFRYERADDLARNDVKLSNFIEKRKNKDKNNIYSPNDIIKNLFYKSDNFCVEPKTLALTSKNTTFSPIQNFSFKDIVQRSTLATPLQFLSLLKKEKVDTPLQVLANESIQNESFKKVIDQDRFSFLQKERAFKLPSISSRNRFSPKVAPFFCKVSFNSSQASARGNTLIYEEKTPIDIKLEQKDHRLKSRPFWQGYIINAETLLNRNRIPHFKESRLKMGEKVSDYRLSKLKTVSPRFMSGYQQPERRGVNIKVGKEKTISRSSTGIEFSIKIPPALPFYESFLKALGYNFNPAFKEVLSNALQGNALLAEQNNLPFPDLNRPSEIVNRIENHQSCAYNSFCKDKLCTALTYRRGRFDPLRGNAPTGTEMHRNAPKCTEMHRNAPKCTEGAKQSKAKQSKAKQCGDFKRSKASHENARMRLQKDKKDFLIFRIKSPTALKKIPYRELSLNERREIEPLFEQVNKTFYLSPYRFAFKKPLFADYNDYLSWPKDNPVAISISPFIEASTDDKEKSIKDSWLSSSSKRKVKARFESPASSTSKGSDTPFVLASDKDYKGDANTEVSDFESFNEDSIVLQNQKLRPSSTLQKKERQKKERGGSTFYNDEQYDSETRAASDSSLKAIEESPSTFKSSREMKDIIPVESSNVGEEEEKKREITKSEWLFQIRESEQSLEKRKEFQELAYPNKKALVNSSLLKSPGKIERRLVSDRKASFFGITNLFPKRLISEDQKQITSQILQDDIYRKSVSLLESLNQGLDPLLERKSPAPKSLRTKSLLFQGNKRTEPINFDASSDEQMQDNLQKGIKALEKISVSKRSDKSSYKSTRALRARTCTCKPLSLKKTRSKIITKQHPIYTPNKRLRLRVPQPSLTTQNSNNQTRIDDLNLSSEHRWWQKRRISSSLLGAPSKRYLVMPEISSPDWRKMIEWQLKIYFLEEEKRLLELQKVGKESVPSDKKPNTKQLFTIKKLAIYLPWASLKKSLKKPFEWPVTLFSYSSFLPSDKSRFVGVFNQTFLLEEKKKRRTPKISVCSERSNFFEKLNTPFYKSLRQELEKKTEGEVLRKNRTRFSSKYFRYPLVYKFSVAKSIYPVYKRYLCVPSVKSKALFTKQGKNFLQNFIKNKKTDSCFVSSISFSPSVRLPFKTASFFVSDKSYKTSQSDSLRKVELCKDFHKLLVRKTSVLPRANLVTQPPMTCAKRSPLRALTNLRERSEKATLSSSENYKEASLRFHAGFAQNKLDQNTISKPFLFEAQTQNSYLFLHGFFLVIAIKRLFDGLYKIFGTLLLSKIKNSSLSVLLLPLFFNAFSSSNKLYSFHSLKTRAKHLAGSEDTISSLSEIVWFLRNSCRGRLVPRGVVLVEKASSESTNFLKAIGGEAQVPVIVQSLRALPYTQNHPQRQLEKILTFAQKRAPCILFLDDIDSIGQSRTLLLKNNEESDLGNTKLQIDYKRKTPRVDTCLKRSSCVPFRTGFGGDEGLSFAKQNPLSFGGNAQKSGQRSQQEKYARVALYSDFSSYEKAPKVQKVALAQRNWPKYDGSGGFLENFSDPEKATITSFNTRPETEKTEKVVEQRRVDLMLRLLTVMDGISGLNGVLIVTTSKKPSRLDPALLRPGRFEKLIHLNPPNKKKRISLLKRESARLGHTNSMPWEYFGRQTQDMTGSEITSAVNHSAFRAIIQSTVHTFPTLEYGINRVARSSKSSLYKSISTKDKFLRPNPEKVVINSSLCGFSRFFCDNKNEGTRGGEKASQTTLYRAGKGVVRAFILNRNGSSFSKCRLLVKNKTFGAVKGVNNKAKLSLPSFALLQSRLQKRFFIKTDFAKETIRLYAGQAALALYLDSIDDFKRKTFNTPFLYTKKRLIALQSSFYSQEGLGASSLIKEMATHFCFFPKTKERNYFLDIYFLYYNMVLTCFYVAFQNCTENRELLDYVTDHLIRFKVLKLHEMLRTVLFYS